MKKSTQENEVMFRMGCPIWWHFHGFKMHLERLDLDKKLIVISNGDVARISITKISGVFQGNHGWCAEWEITQNKLYNEGVKGKIRLTDDGLKIAFGLSQRLNEPGKFLCERFGADVADQGKYIRWEDCLNIPGPGNGLDGDPNISICIDKEMKSAVQQLLEQSGG